MRISIFVSILLLSGCVCAPVVTDDVVQLPCCGSVNDIQTVNISTGTGPWRVTVPNGSVSPVVAAENRYWVPMSDPVWSPSVPASWVGPPGTGGPRDASRHVPPDHGEPIDPGDPQGDYVYEVRFNAPHCQFARTITVSGSVAADNRATIFFGSGSIPPLVASQPPGWGFQAASVIRFSTTLTNASGAYVLRVVVHNGEGPTGLALQAVAVSRCAPLP
jgi:hypothetical protein